MDKLPANIWHVYWFFVKKQPVGFAVLTIAAIMANLSSSILWPYTAGQLVDVFSSLDAHKMDVLPIITTPALFAMGIWAVIEASQRLKGFMLAYVMPRLQANIRMTLFHIVSKHSYAFFIQKHVGSVAQRINDLPKSAHLVIDNILTIFLPLIISILISSSAFFALHPMISQLFLCWIVIHCILCIIFCVKASEHASQQQAIKAVLQGKIVDSIANHLIVKTFTGHTHELQTIQAVQENELKKFRFSLFYIEKFKVLLSMLSLTGATTLFYAVIQLWQQDVISVGDIVFISNTVVNLLTNLWFASDEISYSIYEIGVCKQSLVVIQDPVGYTKQNGTRDLHIIKGDIEFNNVTFRYDNTKNILHKLCFKIQGGERIGLVGFSGSGKTTVVNLLMRLYEVTNGIIKIDEQDISQVPVEAIRKHISFIPQDPMLFHRSIVENIRYGNPNATIEEVIEAASKAKCHDFILQLEHGYNTMVGERGAKLSGGQRQRIAMARAVLKNAAIIIMDEATSALDSVTEKLIEQSIDDVMRGRTSILIAHRLSTLLHMNRIFVFDHGKIIENGSHAALLEQNGHYAKLWSMQQNGCLPDSSSINTII